MGGLLGAGASLLSGGLKAAAIGFNLEQQWKMFEANKQLTELSNNNKITTGFFEAAKSIRIV